MDTIRSQLYSTTGLQIDLKPEEKPLVCFFNRYKEYVSDNAGDHPRSQTW